MHEAQNLSWSFYSQIALAEPTLHNKVGIQLSFEAQDAFQQKVLHHTKERYATHKTKLGRKPANWPSRGTTQPHCKQPQPQGGNEMLACLHQDARLRCDYFDGCGLLPPELGFCLRLGPLPGCLKLGLHRLQRDAKNFSPLGWRRLWEGLNVWLAQKCNGEILCWKACSCSS